MKEHKREEKRLKNFRDKNEGTYRSGEGGEEPPSVMPDELHLGREKDKKCEDKWEASKSSPGTTSIVYSLIR